jgi:nucleoredoxin
MMKTPKVSSTCWQVQFPEIDGKIIGLYFAANWYPKCEAFTPVLAAAYEQLKERGAGFEVVLVSCDEDRPSFERFHRTMPWPAVPFGDLRCKKRLSERFQVEGIPRLVVLAPDGAVLHPDAADLVHRYGERAFPFTAARVAELEADDQRKYASQTLEKLFSINGKEYVNGGNEQVTALLCAVDPPVCTSTIQLLTYSSPRLRAAGSDLEPGGEDGGALLLR